MFLDYIIREFALPATKDGKGWEPRLLKTGGYALFAEVAEDAIQKPKREPRQPWKRRKNAGPAPNAEDSNTNKTVSDPA
jgi:hypothetical protein